MVYMREKKWILMKVISKTYSRHPVIMIGYYIFTVNLYIIPLLYVYIFVRFACFVCKNFKQINFPIWTIKLFELFKVIYAHINFKGKEFRSQSVGDIFDRIDINAIKIP